jgi:formate hydrogenlyase subunit 6/NADH:ubiquinone oxidoreductase subunit I
MKLRAGAMLPEILRHLFRRPATVETPFVEIPLAAHYRGKPVMDPELCIGCQRCVKDCPSEALKIDKVYEYADAQGKKVRRFMMTLYVDRCTHCSQCAEVCPVSAIHMDADYAHAAFTREELTFFYKPVPPPAGAVLAAPPAPPPV